MDSFNRIWPVRKAQSGMRLTERPPEITSLSGHHDLAEIQQRLAAIVESSDDAIISKNLAGVIQSWNRGAERIFGYSAEEAIGKHISMLAASDRVDEIPRILGRIARGERVDHYETKRRTKDGRVLTVSITVSPLRDGSGIVIGASKIARDITERERHRRALEEANIALRSANADLEHFAYSASHDLQEPLRMVAAYSGMLKRKFDGELGELGDQYIAYLIEGAQRMKKLLDDLLAYTRASMEGPTKPEPVDATFGLDAALNDLAPLIQDNQAQVMRTDLPHISIHPFQIEQLFQNLIANAIRYRSKEPPRIHIAAKQSGTEWLFSVRDNGIGIDPQYQEQIFEMFTRLHGPGEYPGTGMGLAICQRIVRRAGGRIWVDSRPGQGSTFFFTLPE
jgi:PAS domain S-box-containing protein